MCIDTPNPDKMKTNSTLTLACLTVAGMVGYYVYAGQNSTPTLRNNWMHYIYTVSTDNASGRIDETNAFQIPVRNNTDYLVDEVDVTVSYRKEAGEVLKDEKVAIFNIPPHSVKLGTAPNGPRGSNVQLKISEVISHSLNLCYPGSNRDYHDPYKCN